MQKTHALHSRYNPKAEAERYLDSIELKKDLKLMVLIEPGMGYITASLRKRNPNSKIIALHARQQPESMPLENIPDAYWSPEKGISLRHFLEQEIPDIEASAIKIIEWRPGLSVYGEAYLSLLAGAVEIIKQADASARTQNMFGRKWFRNFFRNLNLVSYTINPVSFSFPVLITGSGPGLEDSLAEIKKAGNKTFLLAVSSSVTALGNKNLNPDLIITTDGGNWALLHLYECVRNNASNINLAINMCAAIPSQCKDASFLLICDGSLWQSLVLRELKIPFITLPQRGTVSASALDLAFALTSDRVIFTGIDLAHKDLLNHARPYSFDRLWEEKANRLSPYYSQTHARSGLIKSGGSHDIYASWFSHQLNNYPKRLFSLGSKSSQSNNKVFNSLESTSLEINSNGNKPALEKNKVKFIKNPAMLAANFLISEINNSSAGKELFEELSSLLYPDKTLSRKELSDAILNLTRSFWINNQDNK